VVVEFAEVGIVDADDAEGASAVVVASPEVGASFVASVETEARGEAFGYDDFGGGFGVVEVRQASAYDVACKERGVEIVIDAFEDDALDLEVGFEHAAFVGVGVDVSDTGEG